VTVARTHLRICATKVFICHFGVKNTDESTKQTKYLLAELNKRLPEFKVGLPPDILQLHVDRESKYKKRVSLSTPHDIIAVLKKMLIIDPPVSQVYNKDP